MRTTQPPYPAETSNHVSMRCPACHKHGLFYSIHGIPDAAWSLLEKRDGNPRSANRLAELAMVLDIPISYSGGVRICPNSDCRELVFVVQRAGHLVESFPAEPLEIDLNGLPHKVADSLEEAVRCHAAGCYRAAAIMVRRSLEELCDERGAKGRDLKARIDGLKDKMLIPEALLEGAHELRILGNDAAHLEGRAYDDISSEEVEVAIELTSELVKAIYQHRALLEKMRALKKPPTQAN